MNALDESEVAKDILGEPYPSSYRIGSMYTSPGILVSQFSHDGWVEGSNIGDTTGSGDFSHTIPNSGHHSQ